MAEYNADVSPWGSSTPSTSNNMGNIRDNQNGGFKKYNTPEGGALDQMSLLNTYQTKHNLNTIGGIINRWAPPTENKTSQYANFISHQMGVGVNDTLDLKDPNVLGTLAYYQALMEKGRSNVTLTKDQYIQLASDYHNEKKASVAPWEQSQSQPPVEAPVSPSERPREYTATVAPWEQEKPVQSDTERSRGTQGDWQGAAGYLQPTARGLTGAAVSVANIPAELTDAVTSAAAYVGGKLGIGNGTYQPAPRVSTADVEQGLGLQAGALTPQSTKEKVFAGALPFLTPAGVEEGATVAASKIGKAVDIIGKNAINSLTGTFAQNANDKYDPEKLLTDLSINSLGGAVLEGFSNFVGKGIKNAKGLLNLSNDVAASKASQTTERVLSENVDQTANDLTKADLRYKNAMRKGLPEDEINSLRESYLTAEENYNAAKQAHNDHIQVGMGTSPDELLNATEQANNVSQVDHELLKQYGITPGKVESLSNSKIVKLGAKGIQKSVSAGVGTVAGHVPVPGLNHLLSFAAYKSANKAQQQLMRKFVSRYGAKGLKDIQAAAKGEYSPNRDLDYQEALHKISLGMTKAALQGNTE